MLLVSVRGKIKANSRACIFSCFLSCDEQLKKCPVVYFMVFQKSLMSVFGFKFKGVTKRFQGCLKEVIWLFMESFKGVSTKFQGCFWEVSRVF